MVAQPQMGDRLPRGAGIWANLRFCVPLASTNPLKFGAVFEPAKQADRVELKLRGVPSERPTNELVEHGDREVNQAVAG